MDVIDLGSLIKRDWSKHESDSLVAIHVALTF